MRFATFHGLKGSSYLASWEDVLSLLSCHAVSRVHAWFMIKGSQTGFLQQFQKSQNYWRPMLGLNPSSSSQSVLHIRDKSRGAEERRKPKSGSTKISRKKHLFRYVERNSQDNYFFLCGYTCVVLWPLDGQSIAKGFIKIDLSLWHRTVLAWKVDCSKVLILDVELSLCKYDTLTLSPPGCWDKQMMVGVLQWYFQPHPSHLTSHHQMLHIV